MAYTQKNGQSLMNYFDGLALLIELLSLPSFVARYRKRGRPDLTPTTSRANPEETVTRIVNLLERLMKLSQRRGTRRRIAIVFTKADVLGFAQELGIRVAGHGVDNNWNSLGADGSLKTLAWIARNEPQLLQILETRFMEIRFSAVSALGHIPQTGRSFSPQRVMEPLAWLLAKRPTFARPLFGRVVGRMKEAGAVAAVFGVLVVLPLWDLLWWRLR